MAHRNARLTVHGRRLLIQRVVTDGRPVAHVVKELGCSRATGYKWLARWRAEGAAGLADRPSAAHRLPGKTAPELEARIRQLRTTLKRGPRRLAPLLGVPASTVHAVLTRHGLHRLAWLDRPTGQLIRRYERDRPGELIHVDVKKIGRLRDGGGWRVHGRGSVQDHLVKADRNAGRRVGYEYVHAAIDPHPAGLRRDPSRREVRHLRRVPAPRRRLVHHRGHRPDRAGDDRRRPGLPPRPRLARRAR